MLPHSKAPVVSRAAAILWLLLIVNGLALTAILHATGRDATIARPLRRFLAAVQQTDSWRPMAMAEQYLSAPHERPVYQEMLEERAVKFQYPLSSLLFTRHLNLSSLNGISWVSIVVVAIANWRILRRSGVDTPLEFRRSDPAVGLALVGLTLTFYPVMESYSLGQIQAWINACFALALLAWISGRQELAGVAVGLACLWKPTYLVFAVWALLRRRVRFLLPLAGTVALGTAAAIVAYGWTDNLDYVRALRIMSRGGEAFYPNQSVNGLLNRAFQTAASVQFDRHAFAPFHPVVYAGTLVAFVSLLALALWLPARRGAGGTLTDFSILLLTVTMASPIAWVHHYGVLLPILVALAPGMLATNPWGRWTWPALAVAYVAASQHIGPFNRAAATLFGLPQSYVFAAGLVVLAMLYASLRHAAGRGEAAPLPRGLPPENPVPLITCPTRLPPPPAAAR